MAREILDRETVKIYLPITTCSAVSRNLSASATVVKASHEQHEEHKFTLGAGSSLLLHVLDNARRRARALIRPALHTVAENLQGGVSRHAILGPEARFHRGINLGKRHRRVVGFQLGRCLLVLGRKALAVTTPTRVKKDFNKYSHQGAKNSTNARSALLSCESKSAVVRSSTSLAAHAATTAKRARANFIVFFGVPRQKCIN